jgi:hypothetical protein
MGEQVRHLFVSLKGDSGDSSKVRPSDWNQNHTIVEDLVNNSGVSLVPGDVVVMNTAANNSVITSTTQGDLKPVGVHHSPNPTVDGATGNFSIRGLAGGVKVQGAVSVGQHLRVSATAKNLEAIPNSENTGYAVGSVGIARTAFAGPGAGTCNVLLWGFTMQPPFLKGADIASATALNPDKGAQYFAVTGTTSINTIGSRPAGTLLILRFDGVCKVENSANIILLSNGAFMDAGHLMVLISEGAGVWREIARSNLNQLDPLTNTTFYEDFQALSNVISASQGLVTTGQSSWRLNDGAGSAGVANLVDGSSGGVIRIGGTAAVGVGFYLTRDGSSNNSCSNIFSSTKQPTLKMRFAMVDGTATGTRRIGLGNDAAQAFTSDPDDGIYVRFTETGNIIAVCRSANTESTLDTGVAIGSSGTFHNVRLRITTSVVDVFVNDVHRGQITTNIPTSFITAFMSTGTGTNNARIDVDYMHIVQGR